MKLVILLLVLSTVAALVSGCSESSAHEGEIVGIVTEVTGDLSGVESFVVLDTEGDSFRFKPRSGLLVMGAPPSHLRDHVLSGELVRVAYHEDSKGELIADEVSDA
jgi:hypothetical protein